MKEILALFKLFLVRMIRLFKLTISCIVGLVSKEDHSERNSTDEKD